MSWRDDAVCRDNPDLWFSAPDRSVAMHICRAHCPVVAQCAEDAIRRPPRDGVQAGVAFNDQSVPFAAYYYTPAGSCPRCVVPGVKPPPTITGACGTYAGYRRHLRAGEQADEPCRAAAARRGKNERALASARRAARSVREDKE